MIIAEVPLSLPAIVLALTIASLYGGLFHFLCAQRASHLPRYWLGAIVGFAVGQALGMLAPWRVATIGDVRLLEGTFVCAAALFLVRWLVSKPKAK